MNAAQVAPRWVHLFNELVGAFEEGEGGFIGVTGFGGWVGG